MEVIKIGDNILVNRTVWSYTTHMRYAEALGLDAFDYEVYPHRLVSYEVVGMLYDQKRHATILGIQSGNGSQYIIDARGVVLHV